MIAVFLGNGFEEIEALAVVDILRRAELEVAAVGVGGRMIKGAHGIDVAADIEDIQLNEKELEAVVLPGGSRGTHNLERSPVVQRSLEHAVKKGLPVCAICAAPSILGHKGYLKGREAICYPGFEQDLIGAKISSSPVVCDGQFITAKGAGVAIEFGLKIVSELVSPECADSIRKAIQCSNS